MRDDVDDIVGRPGKTFALLFPHSRHAMATPTFSRGLAKMLTQIQQKAANYGDPGCLHCSLEPES